jgi:hypothetical protein
MSQNNRLQRSPFGVVPGKTSQLCHIRSSKLQLTCYYLHITRPLQCFITYHSVYERRHTTPEHLIKTLLGGKLPIKTTVSEKLWIKMYQIFSSETNTHQHPACTLYKAIIRPYDIEGKSRKDTQHKYFTMWCPFPHCYMEVNVGQWEKETY